jgi:hypothetical protein
MDSWAPLLVFEEKFNRCCKSHQLIFYPKLHRRNLHPQIAAQTASSLINGSRRIQ